MMNSKSISRLTDFLTKGLRSLQCSSFVLWTLGLFVVSTVLLGSPLFSLLLEKVWVRRFCLCVYGLILLWGFLSPFVALYRRGIGGGIVCFLGGVLFPIMFWRGPFGRIFLITAALCLFLNLLGTVGLFLEVYSGKPNWSRHLWSIEGSPTKADLKEIGVLLLFSLVLGSGVLFVLSTGDFS